MSKEIGKKYREISEYQVLPTTRAQVKAVQRNNPKSGSLAQSFLDMDRLMTTSSSSWIVIGKPEK